MIRFDMRKQRIFAALETRTSVDLDQLAAAAEVTRAFAARELKRLGWNKRTIAEPGQLSASPRYWRPGYPRRSV
jgi:DeoR/GlpR family transcriptional regulator of sugar metabolism